MLNTFINLLLSSNAVYLRRDMCFFKAQFPLSMLFAQHHIFNNLQRALNSTHVGNNNSKYKSKDQDVAKPKIISAITYPNADTYKLDVYKDNNNKTGIYK